MECFSMFSVAEYNMTKYGMYVKFITHDGKRDELTANLLQVANNFHLISGCELYVINHSSEDENVIWVTEVWASKEAHEASLTLEGNKEQIAASLPLIKKIEKIELQTLGGHSLHS